MEGLKVKSDRLAHMSLAEQLQREAEARFLSAKENQALAQRFAAIKPAPIRNLQPAKV
jgi:hypothetical protein